ncbi:GNAT family N-acetyltransferase [Streptomyces massasporeus]
MGHAEIRWTGCAAPEVRAAQPGCPEINGLFVRPASLRSQGIGTALVHTAERLARERGIDVDAPGPRQRTPGAGRALRVPREGLVTASLQQSTAVPQRTPALPPGTQ